MKTKILRRGTPVPIPLLAGAVALLFGFVPVPTEAKPEIRQGFFDAYPSALGTVLDNLPSRIGHCGVCHYRFQGGGERNYFGARLETALESFPKTPAGYRDANLSIRNIDADNDVFTTLTEITATAYANVPTFPGLTPANVGLISGISSSDEILVEGHLVPASTIDTTPPVVTVTSPSGGSRTGNTSTVITWTATDARGIAGVSLYLSLDNGATYTALVYGVPNSGSYVWFPPNRPTTQARIRVVAIDNASNRGSNQSAIAFAIVSPPGGRVPTTLRDFDLPGTQPLELTAAIAPPSDCASCHGNYNAAVEPFFTWQGSMMAHASIDPLFEANMVIANQDAPDSADLCLRCHIYSGWVQGRSVPTSGAAMLAADKHGVSCDICHRMVDPVYKPGISPLSDQAILAALSFKGTNIGNGMIVVDPAATRRGPVTNAVSPHEVLVSTFHKEAAICGSCHDVSNPVFEKDAQGAYGPNALNTVSSTFSAHRLGPVERTYSEWFYSSYNSAQGVNAPQFAGNKPGGRVATCQDCHMRDATGTGCDPAQFPAVPTRTDLPMHDLTGSSTWLPLLLPSLYPGQVNPAAVTAGVNRATAMLRNAAALGLADASGGFRLLITNNTGHKLPTGYPEGRRMWVNVKFFNGAMEPLGESGVYEAATGILHRDSAAQVYEVHPGIDTNLSGLLGLPIGPSLHFVLNNRIFEDNRIPPRGFSNTLFAAFGGAPVGHAYADGQYWDDVPYELPQGATRAEVRLYFQSTSKEFIEFLRDENRTNSKGQELYNLWNNNGKCPPTLMAETVWTTPFQITMAQVVSGGAFRVDFLGRAGMRYTIEFTDSLTGTPVWRAFVSNGTKILSGTTGFFVDDFTSNSSGGSSATGSRFYRFRYDNPL